MHNESKIGIMQPYFFPYLGYFDLINRTNKWIVFDTVKYSPKSWMNRNRILHPTCGWQYINVPVDKHVAGGLIKDVKVKGMSTAHKKIQGQIEHYRRGGAPYFSTVAKLIDDCFNKLQGDLLCDVNVCALSIFCDYLGITFNYSILSRTPILLPEIQHPGQWALEIADAFSADIYINPPGGRSIFKNTEWEDRSIKLGFTKMVSFFYSTKNYIFIEHLSIIDILMWNSPEDVKSYLDSRLDDSTI
jgi:hypothetical protein